MRVLVLDDNPDDRQLVLHELAALYPDAETSEPNDSGALRDALDAGRPDLVLTDLDLRWTSGRDVLDLVKSRYPGCPVVMFTGSGDETTAVELMKSGLDDYVVKSLRGLPRLRASIRNTVEAAASRTALTEREAQLTAALAHKDLLVRELHHRVRNNLQVVEGLLRLSGKHADAGGRALIADLAGRLRALSLVQARISETEDLDRVDFAVALGDIAASLHARYGDRHARLEPALDGPLVLEVGRAMPLGLLCHEVILNALKHAWPQRGPAAQPGTLAVTLRTRDGAPEIEVRDDGVGYQDGAAAGLGTRLMGGLAAEALAEIRTITAPGAGTVVALRLA